MPEFELITPFPESDLPAVWLWIQPYQAKTEYYDLSENEFVAIKREEQERITTWAIVRNNELGGYIQFDPEGERVGFMSLLCKAFFFRFFRRSVVMPALTQALDDVFTAGANLVLFDPLHTNNQMIHLIREIGARDCGVILANGMPEKRALAIGSGDWDLGALTR